MRRSAANGTSAANSQSAITACVARLPTAAGCRLMETATSVRRRFAGSSQASKRLASAKCYTHCTLRSS